MFKVSIGAFIFIPLEHKHAGMDGSNQHLPANTAMGHLAHPFEAWLVQKGKQALWGQGEQKKKKREVVQWLGHLAQRVGGSPGFWR